MCLYRSCPKLSLGGGFELTKFKFGQEPTVFQHFGFLELFKQQYNFIRIKLRQNN
uniref:Uncharacterized protein n=1 Tax=Arundo donax TaxID=35708 RepID=A0A0A9BMY5_ARUDO